MRQLSSWTLCVSLTILGTLVADAKEHKLSGENTKIEFVGSKKDGKHVGAFPKLSGTFDFDGDPTKGKISVTIDMEALTSDNEMLTAHLKNVDFFETKKYPESKFVSKSIKADKDGFKVTGDLTMHGKTKEISFIAKISDKTGAATLSSKFKINRSDWGITYKKGEIDEEVGLVIEVNAR